MIKLISPGQFKTIPWKNGLGETTELAISEHGTLDYFDWRLSIASVVSNGSFSDFNGYDRNLILIEGCGICLTHDDDKKDNLLNILDKASFSGGSKTVGTLTRGAIKDFNIMTNQKNISPEVHCLSSHQKISVTVLPDTLYFAYSLSADMGVEASFIEKAIIPMGSLLEIHHSQQPEKNEYSLHGSDIIFIKLTTNLKK